MSLDGDILLDVAPLIDIDNAVAFLAIRIGRVSMFDQLGKKVLLHTDGPLTTKLARGGSLRGFKYLVVTGEVRYPFVRKLINNIFHLYDMVTALGEGIIPRLPPDITNDPNPAPMRY